MLVIYSFPVITVTGTLKLLARDHIDLQFHGSGVIRVKSLLLVGRESNFLKQEQTCFFCN